MFGQVAILLGLGHASFSLGYFSTATVLIGLAAANAIDYLLHDSCLTKIPVKFPPSTNGDFRVLIVGSGIGGILMGAKLKMHGFQNFMILEKGSRVGGVWDANVYPGIGCDIASHLYSFSFALNPWWRNVFATGEEIRNYLDSVAQRFDLGSNTVFNAEVDEMRWVEESKSWDVLTTAGDRLKASFVITATGLLHVPQVPKFDGVDAFGGRAFHSSRWPADFDPRGKRVGVIGTGATAIQIVPKLGNVADAVTVFQRSPAYVPVRLAYNYPAVVRLGFWMFPLAMRWCRLINFLILELVFNAAFFHGSRMQGWFGNAITWFMKKDMEQDEGLMDKLLPDYPLGCKRLTPSDDYIKAFRKPSVNIVTDKIAGFDEDGVVVVSDANGKCPTRHPLDAVVYCTGFSTVASVKGSFRKVGRGKKDLAECWDPVPRAFYGVAYPDFPNMFMVGGPNSGGPSNSMIFMFEAQADYIVNCLRVLSKRAEREAEWSMSLKPEALDRFLSTVRNGMQGKSFEGKFCSSWFSTQGINWVLWPFSATSFSRHLGACNEDDYDFS